MNEQIDALRLAESVFRAYGDHHAAKTDIEKAKRNYELAEQMRAALLDTLPEAPAPQEPVAWRVHPFDYGVGSKGVYALTMLTEQVGMWERKGWKVEPLYAAPQLSAQPEPEQQKPAALVKVLEAGGNAGIATRIVEVDDPMRERLQPGTKLYAAPQPARQPLTEDQLRDALRQCPHDTAENLRVRWLYAKDFARAIEAAHGITESQP